MPRWNTTPCPICNYAHHVYVMKGASPVIKRKCWNCNNHVTFEMGVTK